MSTEELIDFIKNVKDQDIVVAVGRGAFIKEKSESKLGDFVLFSRLKIKKKGDMI